MPLQVIGAGFGRTGTASLKVALDRLGVGPCYHMSEVFQRPEHVDLWLAVAAGRPDWEAIFGAYGSAVDFPACTYWRELAERYPDAKIVLTVRDPGRWFDSTQETILSPACVDYFRGTPFGEMLSRTVWDVFDGRVHEREHLLGRFDRHVAEVRRAIPAERLLVYEVGQGWSPLCEFLGLPVPKEPFPRVNSREETARMLQSVIDAGVEGVRAERLAEAGRRLHGEA